MMKTSFAKTFERLSEGKQPEDERFHEKTTCEVKTDGNDISKEMIYVLRSEKDIGNASQIVTSVLVNPKYKERYDELVVDIEKKKTKLISALQKSSGVTKTDVEKTIFNDCGAKSLPACLCQLQELYTDVDGQKFKYSVLFDEKTVALIQSTEFLENANSFAAAYQAVFDLPGTIYQKSVFNPTKADTAFDTLKKQNYFKAGHKIHFSGDRCSIDEHGLDERLNALKESIDSDGQLKALQKGLAKNAQTLALNELIETASIPEVDFW